MEFSGNHSRIASDNFKLKSRVIIALKGFKRPTINPRRKYKAMKDKIKNRILYSNSIGELNRIIESIDTKEFSDAELAEIMAFAQVKSFAIRIQSMNSKI